MVEIAAQRAAAPPVNAASGKLFEDVSGLPKVLLEHHPEAVQLLIYTDFAIITAPEPTSSTAWGRFTYRGGAITGLTETTPQCKKTLRFADYDLTLVPKLVTESLKRAGGSAEVVVVNLSRGVFCKKVGWMVNLKNAAKASRIEFKPDGKLKKIWP